MQRTINAGISNQDALTVAQPDIASSTNAALLDEAVAFCVAIHSSSLSAIRKKNDCLDTAKQVLGLCNEMRLGPFPELGVDILDSKVVEEAGGGDAYQGWSYPCVMANASPSSDNRCCALSPPSHFLPVVIRYLPMYQ